MDMLKVGMVKMESVILKRNSKITLVKDVNYVFQKDMTSVSYIQTIKMGINKTIPKMEVILSVYVSSVILTKMRCI